MMLPGCEDNYAGGAWGPTAEAGGCSRERANGFCALQTRAGAARTGAGE